MRQYLVTFVDETEWTFEAEYLAQEGNLTLFYDDKDKMVGGVITSKLVGLQRVAEEPTK